MPDDDVGAAHFRVLSSLIIGHRTVVTTAAEAQDLRATFHHIDERAVAQMLARDVIPSIWIADAVGDRIALKGHCYHPGVLGERLSKEC